MDNDAILLYFIGFVKYNIVGVLFYMEDLYLKKSFVLQIEGRYRQWDVIARRDDGYLVMAHEIMYHVSFGATNRWKDCFIRNYLQDVWMRPIREAFELKNIDSSELLYYRTETTRDRIFILSKDEHTEYRPNIPVKSSAYWLRSSYGHLHTPYAWVAAADGHHMGEPVSNSSIGICPVIYVSERAIRLLCPTTSTADTTSPAKAASPEKVASATK